MLPPKGVRPGAALAALVIALFVLAGCGTARHTAPARTATEQMIISAAADRAAERLTIGLAPGTRVFVNGETFEAYDARYALGAIRAKVLESGANLVSDRRDADVIVDARSGALSIDESDMLIGIPGIELPIPLAGPFKTPEVALFKRETQRGTAKFAITAYDSRSGELRAASGPVYGFSHRDNWVVLFFISWTSQDYLPEGADDP